MAYSEYLIGKRERMTWIEETGWATGGTPASAEVVGFDCEITPDFSLGYQEILSAGTDDLYIQGLVKGPQLFKYGLKFTPYTWRWLKYLMACTDGTDGAVKTHTFTQRNTIKSWRMDWARRHTTASVFDMVGNYMKKATISFNKATGPGREGFLTVTAECGCKDLSEDSTVETISAISKTAFMFHNVKVTIDGTEYVEVNNGDMTLDIGINENDSMYCSSSYDGLLAEVIPGVMRITGKFNINMKDNALYTLWKAGTAVSGACTLLIDRDGTGNDQILFTFANFHILGAVGPTTLDGPTKVDVVWQAYSFSSVVARDDVSAY